MSHKSDIIMFQYERITKVMITGGRGEKEGWRIVKFIYLKVVIIFVMICSKSVIRCSFVILIVFVLCMLATPVMALDVCDKDPESNECTDAVLDICNNNPNSEGCKNTISLCEKYPFSKGCRTAAVFSCYDNPNSEGCKTALTLCDKNPNSAACKGRDALDPCYIPGTEKCKTATAAKESKPHRNVNSACSINPNSPACVADVKAACGGNSQYQQTTYTSECDAVAVDACDGSPESKGCKTAVKLATDICSNVVSVTGSPSAYGGLGGFGNVCNDIAYSLCDTSPAPSGCQKIWDLQNHFLERKFYSKFTF